LPWLGSDRQLNRSFLTEDYLAATRSLNVVKAVYMEVAVEPQQQLAEAKHVIELCRRPDTPTCAAVIGGQPGSEEFPRYITRFKGSPYVKGVRQILHQPERCLEAKFVAGIRLLGELAMRFDLCIPPAGLPAGAKLAERCPQTRFILDHCGNADPKAFRPGRRQGPGDTGPRPEHDADQWRRDVARVARRPNVVCKISGIVARVPRGTWTAEDLAPIVNHCLEVFGPDRVMFGGDWPVCTRVATLRQWVAALKEIIQDRSPKQQRKLLHDNAVGFYGLT
jgi:L-fuconolactonase